MPRYLVPVRVNSMVTVEVELSDDEIKTIAGNEDALEAAIFEAAEDEVANMIDKGDLKEFLDFEYECDEYEESLE